MPSTRLKIENLDNFQELAFEDSSIIQGGMLAEDAESAEMPAAERIAYPLPHPVPCYPLPVLRRPGKRRKPRPKPDYGHPCVCSPYPTKKGRLPWCAVIL